MTDPWAPPPHVPQQPYQPQPGPPPSNEAGQPHPGPPQGDQGGPPRQGPPQGPPPTKPTGDATPPQSRLKRLLRDPLSIGLVVVIVLALAVAGLVGGELVGRRIADDVVAKATKCVVQDDVSVSFRGATPFLWQHLTKDYSGISITTAGNQIRNIKGMKAQIELDDVRLEDRGNSKGTIGAVNATITWSNDGIKQTLQDSVPLIGGFVSDVTTNPSDGTVELKVPFGSIVAKPEVRDNGVALQVQELTGLGFALPREAVQPALDAFSAQLTKGYPLGIHADRIQVTDSGVISTFSSQNASIPAAEDDPCFAGV